MREAVVTSARTAARWRSSKDTRREPHSAQGVPGGRIEQIGQCWPTTRVSVAAHASGGRPRLSARPTRENALRTSFGDLIGLGTAGGMPSDVREELCLGLRHSFFRHPRLDRRSIRRQPVSPPGSPLFQHQPARGGQLVECPPPSKPPVLSPNICAISWIVVLTIIEPREIRSRERRLCTICRRSGAASTSSPRRNSPSPCRRPRFGGRNEVIALQQTIEIDRTPGQRKFVLSASRQKRLFPSSVPGHSRSDNRVPQYFP
jgi:hypothetical protein